MSVCQTLWSPGRGRHAFEQAVADPDALAELVVMPLAPHRAPLECESVLYIPAEVHRAVTAEELPADAYPPGPREPVGG